MALFLVFQPGQAQKNAIESITVKELRAHLEFIASDELQGRETGSPGIDIAAKYLEATCKRIGLDPYSDKFGYFQHIGFTSLKTDKEETGLEIFDSEGAKRFRTDSIIGPNPNSTNTAIEGEVVYVGYGYQDEESGYDAFGEIDVEGKIVLLMSRVPLQYRSDMPEGNPFFNEKVEMPKVRSAFSMGARAVLFVFDPGNAYSSFYDMGEMSYFDNTIFLTDEVPPPQPPNVLLITQHTANKIIESTGFTLTKFQEIIDTENRPVSMDIINTEVKYNVVKNQEEFVDNNVIGIIEGSDPELKNECVVYTAHYDHVGVDDNGEVFNGADDNGSGTVGLIEIADAYMHLKEKPKRTVVFVWCAAEEKGLYGSMFYANNPFLPLEQTVANINLDMIGRIRSPADTGKALMFETDIKGDDGLFVISGKQSTELLEISDDACKELGIIPDHHNEQVHLYNSDQYHFYLNNIPVLFYHTGIHADLHSIRDELDKINYSKMKRVSQLAFMVGYEVADRPRRIVVDKPGEQ